MKNINVIGHKYGRLLVVSDGGKKGRHRVMVCECDCGNTKVISLCDLRTGHTASCGCLTKDRMARNDWRPVVHGMSNHPIYPVWYNMIRRCYDQNNDHYKWYGERGIAVCDDWKELPNKFIEWAEMNGWEKGLQIDRKNNNGSYCPENCRFVTHRQNQNNTCNSRFEVFFGLRMTVAEAARSFDMPYKKLWKRISTGWPPDSAVSLP